MEIKKKGKISFFKNKTKLYIFRGFYLSHKFIDIIKKFTNHVGLINLLTDSPAVQTSFPKIFVCIFQYFTNFFVVSYYCINFRDNIYFKLPAKMKF